MKHLKLFEEYELDLTDVVIKQALIPNKPDALQAMINGGYDIEKDKEILIKWCKDNGYYDQIEMLDPENFDTIIENTTVLSMRYKKIEELNISRFKNVEKISLYECQIHKHIEIKNFYKLKEIFCCWNKGLTSLEISNCPNIEMIKCTNNDIKELNIQNFEHLQLLSCCENNMIKLNISNCPNIDTLGCTNNKLEELDLVGLDNLKELFTYKNLNLNNLNVKHLKKLDILHCTNNNLNKLDVTNLNDLRKLSCSDNNLKELNLEGLDNLESLACDNNKIKYLDIRNTPNLESIWCHKNKLIPELKKLEGDVEKWFNHFKMSH